MRHVLMLLALAAAPAAAQSSAQVVEAQINDSTQSVRDTPDAGRQTYEDPTSLSGRGGPAIQQKTYQATIGTAIGTEIRTDIGTPMGVPH